MKSLRGGKCTKDGVCDCENNNLHIFCQHWQAKETKAGEHEEWMLNNWKLIPEAKRTQLAALIKKHTPADMLATWQRQRRDGLTLGSDNIRFHFDVGMQIRNTLRSKMTDDVLPLVEYPDGQKYQNWDDFYYGAMYDAAGLTD